jgi:hypothetical protein
MKTILDPIVRHLANRFRWRPTDEDLRQERNLTGAWWADLPRQPKLRRLKDFQTAIHF